MQQVTESIHNHGNDDGFEQFSLAINQHFNDLSKRPLFTCDAGDLYSRYLDSFHDPIERQYHTCNCCRQFIERYGNLVVIDPETGKHESAIWPNADLPAPFAGTAADLRHMVQIGKVDGVFISADKTWGTPEAGGWSHFHVKPQPSTRHRDRVLSAHQVMAQKKQDFGTLSHGLADFSLETIKTALSLLETESLYRSEKVLGPAKFLFELHQRISSAKNNRHKRNLIWSSVAIAPVGFATPRSSMVGTLLEDIAAGKSFEQVKSSFAAKMHPLQYQRPQVPASAGNIVQAEKIVEKLGIASSLKRRFARLDEMKLMWVPKPKEFTGKTGGVFTHLLDGKKSSQPVVGNGNEITWVKFASRVLPSAESMQLFIENGPMAFTGVLTATDPSSPPILQWDSEENRNPVSWYLYSSGSYARQWGLTAGQWEDVSGISLFPYMWGGEDIFPQFAKRALFILPRAKDPKPVGLALFPETLRPELHSIRSTIETFSNQGQLDRIEEGSANGVSTSKGSAIRVRVTSDLGITDYKIDRWD